MSQTKTPVLKVKNKEPGQMSVGANTEVYLDDKRLDSVHFLKIEIKAKKVAKVTLEIYCNIDADLDCYPKIVQTEERPGVNYELGKYSPKSIK